MCSPWPHCSSWRPAGGAASVRVGHRPGARTALELDGTFIAYAVGRSAQDCNRVFVWNLASRGVTKLGRKTNCEQTSTGNAIAAVSVAGKRVLWVHFAGGNIREWSLVDRDDDEAFAAPAAVRQP